VKAIKAVYTEALKDDWMVMSQQMDMDMIEKTLLEEHEHTQNGFEWAYEETKLMQLIDTGECIMSIEKQVGDSQNMGQTILVSESWDLDKTKQYSGFGEIAMPILKFNKSNLEHPRLHYSGLLRVH
jgi:hypothetical protein